MKRFFFENMELVLSALGLLIILAVAGLSRAYAEDLWRVIAIAAVVVGLLHGGIFWIVRHRQRVVRRATIEEIREMLQDVILNQMALIQMNSNASRTSGSLQLRRISDSVTSVSEALGSLSEESLQRWRNVYQSALVPEAEIDLTITH